MPPVAVIVHQIAGRTRFQLPRSARTTATLATIERGLADCPGVTTVLVNPLIGTVLVSHRTGLDALNRYAAEHDLFTLATPGAATPTVRGLVTDGVERLDRQLRQLTGGAYDLDEALFVALSAAIVVQALRGRLLGPASALLSYAAALLALKRSGRRPDSDG